MKFPIGMPEAVAKVVGLKRRAAIEPTPFRKALDTGQSADLKGPVDELDRAHREARMLSPQPTRKPADHLVIRPALGMRRQNGATNLQIGVGAGGVDVVMF